MFQIGWYNEQVSSHFYLDYPCDTVGILVISTPAMFDKAFLPFLSRESCTNVLDPIDQCIKDYFKQVKKVGFLYHIECFTTAAYQTVGISLHDYCIIVNSIVFS